MQTWLARSMRQCGRPADEVLSQLNPLLRQKGFHPRRRGTLLATQLRYWHRPGILSWGELVHVEAVPTGPSSCSVVVTASPIVPLNLFAQSASNRDVSMVMGAIDELGVPSGPVRVMLWNEPVPTRIPDSISPAP
jgi:hypothetical protein